MAEIWISSGRHGPRCDSIEECELLSRRPACTAQDWKYHQKDSIEEAALADAKLDRAPMNEAEDHIRTLERFASAVKDGWVEDGSDDLERMAAISTLEYALSVCRQHYRNYLHVYSIAEKS